MKKLLSTLLCFAWIFALGCFSNTPASPAPTPPAAPVGLTAAAGNSQVMLSWTAATGATSYNLYYATTTGVTTASTTKAVGLTTTTYTATGLTNGTAYFYIVTAVGLGGESLPSVQASANPTAPVAAAPATLTATPGNAQAALSWTASSGAVSYNLYYGTSPGLSIATGTKVGAVSGTSYTVTGLSNSTLYYFLVTAVNTGGESPASVITSATPTNGTTVALSPGTAATATLQATSTASLVYTFPSTALSANAVATIGSIPLAAIPTPLIHPTDTFVASFSLSLNPVSITAFNAPIGISGSTGSSIPSNTTLNLAVLQNNAWVDAATLVVGSTGSLNENLASITLPGLLAPGTYLLYQPTSGTSTAVSNLGVALIGDGGFGMADGSNGIQVIHLYNAAGTLLSTPTISYLDYPGMPYLNSQALTPDGSQGVILDSSGPNRSFSNIQTNTSITSTTTGDISAGVAIAMLPTGDEAVVSNDAASQLIVLSGILAGKPVTSTTIPIAGQRDSLILSADGKVLLARGNSGLSIFSVAAITPKQGSNGATVSHTYTPIIDFPNLGSYGSAYQDGRGGMAISPTDPSRAVVLGQGFSATSVQLITNLTSATPLAGVPFTYASTLNTVSISPDGKLAICGTQQGLEMFSGVDTGTLTHVGTTYKPIYKLGLNGVTLGTIATLGFTLDGKYVVAADMTNRALVVIPFTTAGFAAKPASAIGSVTISAPLLEDQLIIH